MKNTTVKFSEGAHPWFKEALALSGINETSQLYPPQAAALNAGVLEGKNMVVCCNTGAGKTLIAELAALATVLERKKKVVYVVPLRALASEKSDDFKKYSKYLSVALSIGDFDGSDPRLGEYDVIVCTSEKLDSLIRHGARWLSRVGLVVLDEIHEIGSDRGPTLEAVAIKLMKSCKPQVLGLSATIGNAKELSEWLGAHLIESDFRPVPLEEGVLVDEEIKFAKRTRRLVSDIKAQEIMAVEDTIKDGHQALMFLNQRRSAEATAERARLVVKKFLKDGEKEELKRVAEKVEGALDHPTSQCTRLAECIRDGVGWHHAGLVHKQRVLVEEAFRSGLIKFIASTVTLVAGINMPARRIIIRSLSRYSAGKGMDYWPISLYKQAVGRAGRVRYDDKGESVVLAKSQEEADFILDNYVNGKPEPAISQLGTEPVLRMQALGAIAGGFANTTAELNGFFGASFYAHQKGPESSLHLLAKVVSELESWGFLSVEGGALGLTKMGKRVAELYLDPLVAKKMIDGLNKTESGATDFAYLSLVCNTGGLMGVSLRKGEFEKYMGASHEREHELLGGIPSAWDLEFEPFLRALKLATILNEWIEEKRDDYILEEYNMSPGDLRARLENADWLSYSASELATILDKKTAASDCRKLRLRLKHGVREELLKLILLPGVGRVRGRRLYAAGLKNVFEVKKAGLPKVASIIGVKTAKRVFDRMEKKGNIHKRLEE